jgi:hypothetical protein
VLISKHGQRSAKGAGEMKSPEAIRDRLLEMLVESYEIKAAKCEEEAWRTGLPAAMLEGRMDVLQEILNWMDNGESS